MVGTFRILGILLLCVSPVISLVHNLGHNVERDCSGSATTDETHNHSVDSWGRTAGLHSVRAQPTSAQSLPEAYGQHGNIPERQETSLNSDPKWDDSDTAGGLIIDQAMSIKLLDLYRSMTLPDCGIPPISEETWNAHDTWELLEESLEEMVAARKRNLTILPDGNVQLRDIGAYMFSKYAPAAGSPYCLSSSTCKVPSCMLVTAKTTRERTAAYYIIIMLTNMSQVHAQQARALRDTIEYVDSLLENLVDTFSAGRELESTELEIHDRIQKYEIRKENVSIHEELAWDKTVAQIKEEHEARVEAAEAFKKAKERDIKAAYRIVKDITVYTQAAAIAESGVVGSIPIIGDALAGSLTIGVAALSIMNYELDKAKDDELDSLVGGESVPKPIYPRKPAPYIPTWHPTRHPMIGSVGASWRNRADLIGALKRLYIENMYHLFDASDNYLKAVFTGEKDRATGRYLLTTTEKRIFIRDKILSFDCERHYRDALTRAFISGCINYLWRADFGYIAMADTPDGVACNGITTDTADSGPSSLRVCLPTYPNKVFYLYKFTNHMHFFNFTPAVFGKDGKISLGPDSKSYYLDHPAPPRGVFSLENYQLTMEDVVMASMRRYEIYGNKPFDRSSKPSVQIESTKNNKGLRLKVLAQEQFDDHVPPLFDIPIADCPKGECVSPVHRPQSAKPPCLSGTSNSQTEDFYVASGLSHHPFFRGICENKEFGPGCEASKQDHYTLNGLANPFMPPVQDQTWVAWDSCQKPGNVSHPQGPEREPNDHMSPLRLADDLANQRPTPAPSSSPKSSGSSQS